MLNEVQFTINQLESGCKEFEGKEGSKLVIGDWQLFENPHFIDYLRSGWGISIVGAVDYTSSNGKSTLPSSLHYLGVKNQYEAAIYQVGQVLEPYDSYKSYPFFGFGGIPKHMGATGVSHCFLMNGNSKNPEIHTIVNCLATYRKTLNEIQFSGPTYFAPLLK